MMSKQIMNTEPNTALTPEFEAWVSAGRDLALERRSVDWRLADWMVDGREKGFLNQAGFDFLADNLGIAPKRLKVITKAADSFPPPLRDAALSIEHHALVADLPRDEQMDLLKQAKAGHWNDEQLRKQVITHRVQTGLIDRIPQDEWDEHLLTELQRTWNRASATVRQEFLEMAQEADGGLIDA